MIIRSATANDADILAKTISLSYSDVAKQFGITSQNAPDHPSNAESHWIFLTSQTVFFTS